MFLVRVFGVVLNVSYLLLRKSCLLVGKTVPVSLKVVYDSERQKFHLQGRMWVVVAQSV